MNKIISIQTDLIHANFDKTPDVGNIIKTKNNSSFIVEKIIDKNNIAAAIINLNEELKLGTVLINTKTGIVGPIGKNIYGEVFDALGESITNPKKKILTIPRQKTSAKIFDLKRELLETGIKAIDFLTPIFKGNKLGVFGGAGVGKTVVIKEIIFNTSSKSDSKSIFVGIGERSREGQELYSELEESNLLSSTILFFAGMNEFAGARFNVVKSALITAEELRDKQKSDVVMFIDNIFRYIQAGSEVSSSLNRKPSSVGYQSTLLSEVSEIQERINANANGAITSFQSVYIPADDITDPAAVAIFSHLDGSIVLDRKVASENIYPAISISDTVSSNTTKDKIGEKHFNALVKVKAITKRAEELEDIISILGIEELSQEDQDLVKIASQIKNYFTQNFSVAEQFTQKKGVHVFLEQTISEIEKIVNKEYIDIDPSEFLYIESLKEIKEIKGVKND